MRKAHIITPDGKLIGPGPANQIRAEAAKLTAGKLYIDGRRPRKIGVKSQDQALAVIAKEREEMAKKHEAKRKAEAAARAKSGKTPPAPIQETTEETKARRDKEKSDARKAAEAAAAEANKILNKK